jgi:hypothetical protein
MPPLPLEEALVIEALRCDNVYPKYTNGLRRCVRYQTDKHCQGRPEVKRLDWEIGDRAKFAGNRFGFDRNRTNQPKSRQTTNNQNTKRLTKSSKFHLKRCPKFIPLTLDHIQRYLFTAHSDGNDMICEIFYMKLADQFFFRLTEVKRS